MSEVPTYACVYTCKVSLVVYRFPIPLSSLVHSPSPTECRVQPQCNYLNLLVPSNLPRSLSIKLTSMRLLERYSPMLLICCYSVVSSPWYVLHVQCSWHLLGPVRISGKSTIRSCDVLVILSCTVSTLVAPPLHCIQCRFYASNNNNKHCVLYTNLCLCWSSSFWHCCCSWDVVLPYQQS